MAHQISFYLKEEDFSALSQFASENGFVFFDTVFSCQKPSESKDLRDGMPGKNPKKIMVLSTQKELLHIYFNEKYQIYSLDELRSPCIEFFPSGEQDGLFYRGRLFYEGEYWTESGKIQKNEAFLKAADNLFRWFKKHFKKAAEAPFYGAYISQNILRYVQEGGKIAVN
jgi:hypothetical protein